MKNKLGFILLSACVTASLVGGTGATLNQANASSGSTAATVTFIGGTVNPKPPISGGESSGTSTPEESGVLSPVVTPQLVAKLPQTGEKQSNLASLLGIILVLIASVSEFKLGAARRNRKKEA